MAGKVAQSALLAKYGKEANAAVKKHASDPIKLGFQNVPPGIKNGIARVTECGFGQVAAGKQNAGHYYFRAAAVVVEPKSIIVDGREMPVEGMQTSIMEMLCPTGEGEKAVSTEQHIANILNELKKMGGVFDDESGLETMEQVAAAIKEQGPYIRFSTSESKTTKIDPKTKKPYPPKTFENWHGVLEDYQSEGGGETGIVDETVGDADSFNEMGEAPEAETSAPDTEDWDTLVAHYNTLDDDTHEKDELIEKLTNIAIAAGADPDAVGEAEDWDAVKVLMDAASESGDTEGEEEAAEEEFEPSKGSVYGWEYSELKDPKNPKKGKTKKKVEVEVLSVDKAKQTVTLKNNETKKTVTDPKTKKALSVPWSELVVE